MPLNRSALAVAILLRASASAAAGGEAASISLGPNVRVSAAHGARLHHEVTMAASPTDPGRLQSSKPRRQRFAIDALGPYRLDPRGGLGSLISVETKVLGKEDAQ